MPATRNSSQRKGEQGQLFSAWIMGIFIIAAMILYVTDAMRRERLSTQNIIYRELALNVARAGFEQAESFFRMDTSGCYLPSTYAPTSQAWITPWPVYPDAAFMPQSSNTDFYSSISVSTSLPPGTCAGGIIGDVPMDQYVTFTTSADAQSSQLWGRYVVRRQNVQNWSPGPDTATVNTDSNACHDLSAIATQSPLGSGARWSIVSLGYIVRLPQPITTTSYANSLLGNAAAFDGGDLLSAPVTFYNNQHFLLGQARVYGEISRLNFNLPAAAVVVPWSTTPTGATLDINTNAVVSSGEVGGYDYAVTSAQIQPNEGNCTTCVYSSTGNAQDPVTATTSLSSVFPGQTWTTLRATAASLAGGTQVAGYTSSTDLPVYSSSGTGYNSVTGLSYSTQVALPAFYFIGSSLTLTASGSPNYVLSGVGLCVVEGALDIQAGNASTWAGVIYASGQVTLDGPTMINGIIVSGTGISIGAASDSAPTTVAYDITMINYVQSLLQGFTVDSSSIVATGF